MAIFSIIIPVYNEEKFLKNIVEDVLKIQKDEYLIQNNIQLEIIIVDDCSNDNSLKIAKELENDIIKVFSHSINQGKGAALKTGFIKAEGNYIGIQDADREYNPKDYINLIKTLIENNCDVVYGSRFLNSKTKNIIDFLHTFVNKFLTFTSNLLTNLKLTDMETCYKLFKKEVIKQIIPKLKENRFGFEPEITAYIAKNNYKILECPIKYNPRSYKEGKKIGIKDGIRALYCIFHYSAHYSNTFIQIMIYFFIGGFSAVINIILFLILIKIKINLNLSIFIAFIISAIINYLLCILILFKHKARWSQKGEIITYIITLIVMGLLDFGFTNLFLILNFGNFLAKTISNVIGFLGNFLFRKYFVFGKIK